MGSCELGRMGRGQNPEEVICTWIGTETEQKPCRLEIFDEGDAFCQQLMFATY